MSSEFSSYAAMKGSSVEWLGDVPAHWEVRQLGRIGSFSKGSGGTKEDETAEGVPCVRYGDLYTQHRFFIEETKACVANDRAAEYTPIQYGDVLFAGSGETIEEIGKSAVNLLSEPACCGGDVIIFRPSVDVDAKFLGLTTDCPQAAYQKSCMGRGITIMHIYGDELKCLSIALPPLDEQKAIVRYLDWVGRRVGRFVGAKEKLVGLLTEQKQGIIHHAVTRGLNPDAPLKPSGIEWLGDVPAHWDVLPNRALFNEIKDRNYPDEQMLSVTIERGVILQTALLEDTSKKDSSNLDRSSYKLVQPGDIAYNKMRAWQGAIGISRRRGIVSPAYVVQRPRDGVVPEYFHRLFRIPSFAKEAERWSYGITSDMWSLRPEHFKLIYSCLPPLAEQTAIVEHLDRATADIDAAIARTRREIELVREYHTRLTADAVTGKLDLRQPAATLPKVDPLATEDDPSPAPPPD